MEMTKQDVEQIISEQLDRKLGIKERIEVRKLESFIMNTVGEVCPTREFIKEHNIVMTERTIYIWGAIEQWQKQRELFGLLSKQIERK